MNNSSSKMYESFTFTHDTRIFVNDNKKVYVKIRRSTNFE